MAAKKKVVSGVDKNRPKNNPVTPPKKQGKPPIPADFGKNKESLRRLQLGLMLGAKLTGGLSKTVSQGVAKDVYKGTFKEAGRGIKGSVPGGRIHNTQTPKGPDIRSTKVMTSEQLSASQKGLFTRANNISTAAGTTAGKIAGKAAKGVGGSRVIAGSDKKDKPKKKKGK